MPYGNLGKPETASTETVYEGVRVSSGYPNYEISYVQTDFNYEFFRNYDNPYIYRSGNNTLNYHVPKTIYDIPKFEFISYRKVIGFTNRVKKEYFYEADKKDPSISVRKSRKISYKKKVYGYGVRWNRKKTAGKQPTDELLAPNALTYVLQERFCDKPVINLRCLENDEEGPFPYRDCALRWKVFPGEARLRDQSGTPLPGNHDGFPGLVRDPDWLSFSDPLIGLPPYLSDDTLSKLYNKVASEFPDYITDVIQVKSTWKTITRIALAAIEVVWSMAKLDLKRLSGKSTGISAREISSLWLEFIYGVAPVLEDVDQSIDLYLRDVRRWRTYSASKTETVETRRTFDFGSPLRPAYYCDEVTSTKYTIRYGAIMAGDMSFVRKVRNDNSVLSAFGTAWEIIPYSFCIDWIYNLGNYLQSADAFDNYLLHKWRTVLIEQKVTRTFTPRGYDASSATTWSGDSFTLKGRRVTMVRDPSITLPAMPVPRVKRLDQVFNLKRSLNALALFTQLVTRTKSK